MKPDMDMKEWEFTFREGGGDIQRVTYLHRLSSKAEQFFRRKHPRAALLLVRRVDGDKSEATTP